MNYIASFTVCSPLFVTTLYKLNKLCDCEHSKYYSGVMMMGVTGAIIYETFRTREVVTDRLIDFLTDDNITNNNQPINDINNLDNNFLTIPENIPTNIPTNVTNNNTETKSTNQMINEWSNTIYNIQKPLVPISVVLFLGGVLYYIREYINYNKFNVIAQLHGKNSTSIECDHMIKSYVNNYVKNNT
jgi:predicted PurR-regulated permease PerM